MSSDAFAFPQLVGPVEVGDLGDELDCLREHARTLGYREGREQAAVEVASVVAELRAALASVAEVRSELVTVLEIDAAGLALQLAEQILAGALEVAPERVVDGARGALRRLTDRRRVTLVVNPADLELMGGSVAALSAELGGIEHCEVQADRRVGAGGLVLRTAEGEIDVTIDSQLQRAREIVADALRDGH